MQQEERRRARAFLAQALTPAEREVVSLVARERLSSPQAGERLHRSPRTIDHHLSSAYKKLRQAYDLAHADRYTLIGMLGPFVPDA